MSLTINPLITDAGRAALINTNNDGASGRYIKWVGYGAGRKNLNDSDRARTEPIDERHKTAKVASYRNGIDQLAISFIDDTKKSYSWSEMNFYLDDGTLAFIYISTNEIAPKLPYASLPFTLVVKFSDIELLPQEYENPEFSLPTATTERHGIVHFASEAVAKAGNEAFAAISPVTLKSTLDQRLSSYFRNDKANVAGFQFTDNSHYVLSTPGNSGFYWHAESQSMRLKGNGIDRMILNTSNGAMKCGDLSIGDTFRGSGRVVMKTGDQWLQLNPQGDFSNGIFFGSSLLRTDGSLQVGPQGSRFSVNSSEIKHALPVFFRSSVVSNNAIQHVADIGFDWTTQQVYNNAGQHGIQSRDIDGRLGDQLRINSFDNVFVNLDSNNNNSNSSFSVCRHSNKNDAVFSASKARTWVSDRLSIGNGSTEFTSTTAKVNNFSVLTKGNFQPQEFSLLERNQDITIAKDTPRLALHSAQSGHIAQEQAATLSLGENGSQGPSSLHLSYQGDGTAYIGMGNLVDNVPEHWAMQMHYQSKSVRFRERIYFGLNETAIHHGQLSSMRITNANGYVDIGAMNSTYCHFQTSLPQYYFSRSVHANGDIKLFQKNTLLRYSDGKILQNNVLLDDLYLAKNGVAANAHQLAGLSVTNSAYNNLGNKIVRTDHNGYAYFGWINTISGITHSALKHVMVDTGDNFLRKCTLQHLANQIRPLLGVGGGGPGPAPCFALGTRVLLGSGETVPIETLRPGDTVSAFAHPDIIDESEPGWDTVSIDDPGAGQVTETTVSNIAIKQYTQYMTINNTLSVTPMHHLLVYKPALASWRWLLASSIEVGDSLLSDNKTLVTVESVTYHESPLTVVNINVEGDDTYFVQLGDAFILAHNKP